jgi:hypothetical protein
MMVKEQEAAYAAYLTVLTSRIAAQKTPTEAATLAAAMMTAAIAFDANVLGTFGAAERLRDLADEIERGEDPARAAMQ